MSLQVGLNSLDKIHNDVNFIAESIKPNEVSSSNNPPPFFPVETIEDRFLYELYTQNLANEFGILKKITTTPLYLELGEIKRIIEILKSDFWVTDKNGQWQEKLTIQDILNKLRSTINAHRNGLSPESIEIAGSTVAKILSKTFLKQVFQLIGLKNVDEFLEEFLKNANQYKFSDYDIRCNYPKSTVQQLPQMKNDAITTLAKLTKQSFDTIDRNGLDKKFHPVKEDQVQFAIVTTGDHKTSALELLIIKDLSPRYPQKARHHLFFRDALRIPIQDLLDFDGSDYSTLHIPILSDLEDQLQAYVHLIAGIAWDDKPDTINEYGYPTLLTQFTKGRNCPPPNFEGDLFKRCKNLLKVNEKPENQISIFLINCLKNHFQNDLFAGICLLVNICISLQKYSPDLVQPIIKELTPHIIKLADEQKKESYNSSEKILMQILEILKDDPNQFESVYSLLQLHAFIDFSKTHKHQDGNPEYILRKNDGTPAVEMKFHCSQSNFSILFPVQFNDAIRNLSSTFSENKNSHILQLAETLFHVSCSTENGSMDGPSLLQKYASHFAIDWNDLAQKVIEGFSKDNKNQSQLSFLLLSMYFQQVQNPLDFKNEFLAQAPIVLSSIQDPQLQKKLLKEISQVCSKLEFPKDICKPLEETLANGTCNKAEICQTWLIAIANARQSNLTSFLNQIVEEDGFTSIEKEKIYKTILQYLSIHHRDMAVDIMTSFVNNYRLPWVDLWHICTEILGKNNTSTSSIEKNHKLTNTAILLVKSLPKNANDPQKAIFREGIPSIIEAFISNNLLSEAKEVLLFCTQRKILSSKVLDSLWKGFVEKTEDPKARLSLFEEIKNKFHVCKDEEYHINLQIPLIQQDIEQKRFPQAAERIKKISQSTQSSQNVKKVIISFADQIIQSTVKPEWNLQCCTDIVLDAQHIFIQDETAYANILAKLTSKCAENSVPNKQTLSKLLQGILRYCQQEIILTEARKVLALCLADILQVACPPQFNLNEDLKTALRESASHIVNLLEDQSKLIPFLKGFYFHKIRPQYDSSVFLICLKAIANYLKAESLTQQDAVQVHNILEDLAKNSESSNPETTIHLAICQVNLTDLLFRFPYSHPISKLTKNLLQVENSSIDVQTVQKMIAWIPLLCKQGEHKLCLQLIAKLKELNSYNEQLCTHLNLLIEEEEKNLTYNVTEEILSEHGDILIKHANMEQCTSIACNFVLHLLPKNSKIRKVIQIMRKFSVKEAHLWLESLRLCATSSNEQLHKEGWEAFKEVSKENDFLRDQPQQLAQCWMYALQLLNKMQSTDILSLFTDGQSLIKLFSHPCNSDVFYKFLESFFITALQLPETEEKAICLVSQIIPLLKGLDDRLIQNESTLTRVRIDLHLARAISFDANFSAFNSAFTLFDACFQQMIVAKNFLPGTSRTLMILFEKSSKLDPNENSSLASTINSMLIMAEWLIPDFDIFSVLPFLRVYHSNQYIMMMTLRMIIHTIERAIIIEGKPRKKLESLTVNLLKELFLNSLALNDDSILNTSNSILMHKNIRQFLDEKDLGNLWDITFTNAWDRYINSKEPYDLLSALDYFNNIVNNTPNIEFIETYFPKFAKCFNHALVTFEDNLEVAKRITTFLALLDRCVLSSNGRAHKIFSENQIVRYKTEVIKTLLNPQNFTDETITDIIVSYCEMLLTDLIDEHPKCVDEITQALKLFIFSPIIHTSFNYELLLKHCKAIIQKGIDAGIFREKNEIRFISYLLFDMAAPVKVTISEENQITWAANIFKQESILKSPYRMWNLIETIEERMQPLQAFKSKPNLLINCYEIIIRFIKPYMYYHVGGLPIYDFLFEGILNDPILATKKSDCLEILATFIGNLLILHRSMEEKPIEISDEYNPIPYLHKVWEKLIHWFDGPNQKDYFLLIKKLFPIFLRGLHKKPEYLKLYNGLVYKFFTFSFTGIKQPKLNPEDRKMRAEYFCEWIGLLAGSGIPESIEEAKALLAKVERANNMFNGLPDILEKAKKHFK